MKKLAVILVLAILLGGATVAAMSNPGFAQAYEYPPPPPDPYSEPWVGPDTPWVYYNGDWFLNGILYYFFGPQYGWCPYYAYPSSYIVRPSRWYAPLWLSWYESHPVYWKRFNSAYPYWRSHRVGERYDERFYERHHRGEGGGWHHGFRGRPAPPPQPGGPQPGPAQVAPPAGPRPGPAHVTPGERPRPAPTQVAPAERPGPAPGHVAPGERPRPAPTQVAPPPAGAKPAPAPAPKPAPAPAPAPAVKPAPGPAPAPKPAPAPAPAPKPAPAPGAPGAAPADQG